MKQTTLTTEIEIIIKFRRSESYMFATNGVESFFNTPNRVTIDHTVSKIGL